MPNPTDPIFTNIYNFSPTGVAGCYAWYNGSNVGQLNNSTLLHITDQSGSGNNLVGSGLFNTSVINGYPAFSLLGLPGQGFSCSGNDSCNNAPFNISAFYVFSTNNSSGIQGLMSYEKTPVLTATTYYGSFIGQNPPAPSSWSFDYLSASDAAITFNNIPYNSGDWIVRSDRGRTGYVGLYRNSILVGSGTGTLINTPTGFSDQLKIGYTNYNLNNAVFNGQIAETILYSPALSDQDSLRVETYLKYKYFINLVANNLSNAPTLYIGSATVASSSISLFTSGVPPISSGNCTLYLDCAALPISSGVNLYIDGKSLPVPSSLSLFMCGEITANSQLFPLYITNYGLPAISGLTTLYLANGPNPQTNNSPGGFNSFEFNQFLINGIGIGTGQTGTSGIGSNLWLYLQTDNKGSNFGSMPLYLAGPTPSSVTQYTSLYLQNTNQIQATGIKMFIGGDGSLDGGLIAQNSMNLFLDVNQGVYQATTLYMNSQIISSSVPLYLLCGQSGINNNSTLFIQGNPPIATGIISLFCQPTLGISNNFTMMISGYQTPTNNLTIYTNGF